MIQMENYYKLWSDCEQCLSWKIGNCEFSLNSFRYGVRKYDAYEIWQIGEFASKFNIFALYLSEKIRLFVMGLNNKII